MPQEEAIYYPLPSYLRLGWNFPWWDLTLSLCNRLGNLSSDLQLGVGIYFGNQTLDLTYTITE